MNRSGRLALIKSTLSEIPVHIAINLKLDPWALRALEKIMKAFLWSGTEMVSSGKCAVAWAQVQRPLQLGGLGVLDPVCFGQALRLRWLLLRCTCPDCSWALLPSDEDYSLLAFFNRSVRITIGSGTSVLFWSDPWLHGKTIQDIAPHLLQAIPQQLRRNRRVSEALPNRAWRKDIKGALSIPVIIDYIRLCQATQGVTLQPQTVDVFIWRWMSNGEFTSSSAYEALFLGQSALPGARVLWKTRAPNKCRFFLWLCLHGRVWTATRRRKHGIQDTDDCSLCFQLPETLDHLLMQCVFSREVWFKTLRKFGHQHLTPQMDSTLVIWWLSSRKRIPSTQRKTFDSIVCLVIWRIWLQRNECVSW